MCTGKVFKHNRKLVNAPLDFFRVHCSKPHLQSLPLHRTAAVNTEWHYFYLASLRSPRRRLTIDSRVQPAHRLQSSFDAGELQLASALLLVLFGVAMAISFGLKSPLDYSVFSASSAALLLALYQRRTESVATNGKTT